MYIQYLQLQFCGYSYCLFVRTSFFLRHQKYSFDHLQLCNDNQNLCMEITIAYGLSTDLLWFHFLSRAYRGSPNATWLVTLPSAATNCNAPFYYFIK